jgi:Zn finger protein HypA/HybF involved in hydrogenase expression
MDSVPPASARVCASVLLAATLLSSDAAADDAFLGAGACRACHPGQFASQSRSGHAGSLVPSSEHPLASRITASGALLLNGFRYSYVRQGRALALEVRKGGEVRRQVADWAFGAADQAVTFVSRLDEDTYVELRASYYAALNGVGLTPGHQNHHPADLSAALGIRYRTFSPRSEILSCFGCHSTGTLSLGSEMEIRPQELGVRCEACHGPGRKHAELAAQKQIDGARRAIGNPARLAASELMRFCGECHRPPASEGAAIDWSDAWNVRHQPVYLAESACFQRSAGLSCMHCHDPHRPLRRADTAYYNARCASCHSAGALPPADVCRAEPGCASCHMPAVQPQPGLTFHNHWIGVYRGGDPLRPQR